MSTIKIEHLKKSYGHNLAVNDLSLELQDGELFALLGSSGCGKTTTLRCIAGLEEFDSGKISLDGEYISQVPACDRDFGMVFQNYALFPHLSVQENVAYGLMAKRYRQSSLIGKAATLWRSISGSLTNEDKKAVHAVLELVELQDYALRLPSQLSGGQQQRAALARALVTKPKILLFDEPLGALDVKLRLKMREEIRHIQRQAGITALYVTHDQEEALAVSDRLALMDKGQIVQIGQPEELYSKPANKFAAEFIGFGNILAATINEDKTVSLEGNLVLQNIQVPPTLAKGKIYAAIRPEKLKLSTNTTNGSSNCFPAKVTSRMFMGNFIKYTVLCQSQTFTANVAADQGKNEGQPQIGQELVLHIPSESVVLVKE